MRDRRRNGQCYRAGRKDLARCPASSCLTGHPILTARRCNPLGWADRERPGGTPTSLASIKISPGSDIGNGHWPLGSFVLHACSFRWTIEPPIVCRAGSCDVAGCWSSARMPGLCHAEQREASARRRAIEYGHPPDGSRRIRFHRGDRKSWSRRFTQINTDGVSASACIGVSVLATTQRRHGRGIVASPRRGELLSCFFSTHRWAEIPPTLPFHHLRTSVPHLRQFPLLSSAVQNRLHRRESPWPVR